MANNDSKYSGPEFEALVSDLAEVLARHNAPLDMSVIVLGRLVAALMNQQLAAQNKVEIAEKFASAIRQGITTH